MGDRVASFGLVLAGALPANAGLVIETYRNVAATITHAGRDIPTTTMWSGKLVAGAPAASSYALLRPSSGDWPTGSLRVVARECGFDVATGRATPTGRVVAEMELAVGPAVAGAPPTCQYVSAPMPISVFTDPGGGSRQPATGIVLAGIADPGPMVSIEVDYTVRGKLGCAHDLAQTRGVVIVDKRADVKRVRITNVLGCTLELLPPFPRGSAPDAPIAIKR